MKIQTNNWYRPGILVPGAIIIAAIVIVVCTVILIPESPRSTEADICLSSDGSDAHCVKTSSALKSFVHDTLAKKYSNIKKIEAEKIREYFKQYDNTPRTFGSHPSKKPAAKLTGTDLPQRNVTSDLTPVDVWCHGKTLRSNGGFLREGVRYYNGRLVVPVTGIYTVYSFVEFVEPYVAKDDKEKGTKNTSTTIKHGLYKYSVSSDSDADADFFEFAVNEQPRTVQAARIKSDCIYGSHVSSVVKLNAGDEVFVQVTNINQLKYTKDNYFGLMLI